MSEHDFEDDPDLLRLLRRAVGEDEETDAEESEIVGMKVAAAEDPDTGTERNAVARESVP